MLTVIEYVKAKQPEVALILEKLWGPFVVTQDPEDKSENDSEDNPEFKFYKQLMETPPRGGGHD